MVSPGNQRAHPGAREDDPREIQGIGVGDGESIVGLISHAANTAQEFNDLGAGELLSGEPGDKAAAANLALRLHAAKHRQHLAPGRRQRLAGEQVAEQRAYDSARWPGFAVWRRSMAQRPAA